MSSAKSFLDVLRQFPPAVFGHSLLGLLGPQDISNLRIALPPVVDLVRTSKTSLTLSDPTLSRAATPDGEAQLAQALLRYNAVKELRFACSGANYAVARRLFRAGGAVQRHFSATVTLVAFSNVGGTSEAEFDTAGAIAGCLPQLERVSVAATGRVRSIDKDMCKLQHLRCLEVELWNRSKPGVDQLLLDLVGQVRGDQAAWTTALNFSNSFSDFAWCRIVHACSFCP